MQPPSQGVLFTLTSAREELQSAFHLVYEAYVARGAAHPNPYGLRVTPYHLEESTEVVVAVSRGQVVCTGTLVRDGRRGLPMESIYKRLVEERRGQNLRLAEGTCLAHARRSARHHFPHVLGVMRLVLQCARNRGVDQLMLTIHPKHAKFYTQYMGCELVGGLTRYEMVCYQPTVAVCLDINRIAETNPHAYQRFFGAPYPLETFRRQRMSQDVRRWIANLLEATGAADSHVAGRGWRAAA